MARRFGSKLLAAACGIAVACAPAWAQMSGPQSSRPAVMAGSGPRLAYGPVCDRVALRDCKAEAELHITTCDPFPDRFACADRILAEQSACMAATGCY